MIESRDVEFFQHLLASSNKLHNLPTESTLGEPQEIDEPSELRRNTRVRKSKSHGTDEMDS